MIKNNITVKPGNDASSKPVFEINQTLLIPVTIDRVVQYSDKETKYFVKMPEGISYFLSDCPPVAVINEGSLKKIVISLEKEFQNAD